MRWHSCAVSSADVILGYAKPVLRADFISRFVKVLAR
jgi:hypothetical protein